jgi:predicted sulfurtransferase
MMKVSKPILMLAVLLLLAASSACAGVTKIATKEVPRMSVDELNSRLNDPAVVVIDVRSSDDWNKSQAKIKGAVRETGENVPAWAPGYSKDKTIVLYCA